MSTSATRDAKCTQSGVGLFVDSDSASNAWYFDQMTWTIYTDDAVDNNFNYYHISKTHREQFCW